ncbi:hypothetical protein AX16_000844 [Volvariella volvacea WC 439]|nr:hypothetical protein AX16_000844 [Volvariella volvacea WC 439]
MLAGVHSSSPAISITTTTALLESPSPPPTLLDATSAVEQDATNTRTASSIMYSSVVVVLFWTYLSIHHNIPDQKHPWTKAVAIRLGTFMLALLTPEFMVLWAFQQRIMAVKIAERNSYRGWTKTHGFFVQMGGLMQFRNGESIPCRVVTPDQLEDTNIPYIPEKEIKGLGKADTLLRILASLQATWFFTQCVSRYACGLTVTLFEVMALAYLTLNLITYTLWWDKPFNVNYSIYFDEEGYRAHGPVEKPQNAWLWEGQWTWVDILSHLGGIILFIFCLIPLSIAYVFLSLVGEDEHGTPGPKTSVPIFYVAEPALENNPRLLCVSAAGFIFGGIHLLGGLNFHLQPPVESMYSRWRVASLLMTLCPLSIAFFVASDVVLTRMKNGIYSGFKDTLFVFYCLRLLLIFLSFLLYCAIRTSIVYLAFLATPRDSVYEVVKWTEWIPHI